MPFHTWNSFAQSWIRQDRLRLKRDTLRHWPCDNEGDRGKNESGAYMSRYTVLFSKLPNTKLLFIHRKHWILKATTEDKDRKRLINQITFMVYFLSSSTFYKCIFAIQVQKDNSGLCAISHILIISLSLSLSWIMVNFKR